MDITTARGSGEQLLEIQSRLDAILASAMDAVVVAGADGRIVAFNSRAERTFRCRAEEAIGQPLERFLQGTDTNASTESPSEHAHGEMASMVPALVMARRADGEQFLADAVISRTAGTGGTECSVTLRDVSDRRRGEDQLRKLSSAVAYTTDAVYMTDRNGVIEYVNPAFAAMMGVTPGEVIGEKTSVFRSGEHDGDFYEHLWSTLNAGEVYRGVLIDRTRDGRIVHLDQTITPLKNDSGEVTHFVAVGRDITARVETEAALRRLNQTLEQQAKEIAEALHDEAGQMLTSAYIVIAHAKRELPPPAQEYLVTIKQHLEEIEEQLRRLAHELRPRILDDLGLVPALNFLADGVRQRSGMEVRVDSTLATRLPPLVEATIYRFVQEALSNARRHASASEVTVSLEQFHRRVRCTVQDDGVGFDAAAVASREHGMGLSSIRGRIAVLGGSFQIDSTPGRGTQAIITLPAETPYQGHIATALLSALVWLQDVSWIEEVVSFAIGA